MVHGSNIMRKSNHQNPRRGPGKGGYKYNHNQDNRRNRWDETNKKNKETDKRNTEAVDTGSGINF